MSILKIFKSAAKLKKKVDLPAGKGKEVDKSIFRIGVYGHKGVGKTVFFTIVYAFSKKSPKFEIMALGETQEILEEKFNLMRGKGIDLETGKNISARRFPPLSTGEQKLNFEIRVGKNKIVPVNTIDYSGELVYIDSRGDDKQELVEYFKDCECVFFFIDPEAIKNEGERSNRIASFTDLIDQLSSVEKKLKIPIGLVISKADEMPGFKSAEQSMLIGKGAGFIRAMNFAGFLRGVLKQRNITSRPDWKGEVEKMLNRLESFFKPLITRTLDYQVFFISSTGNAPETITDEDGDKVKVPPEDLRPLGISSPLQWAISRIAAYRRAIVYKSILKWTALIILLIVDIVAFGHIYNHVKTRSLFREISQYTGTASVINRSTGNAYKRYSNLFIVRNFFSEFSEIALEQSKLYLNRGSSQAKSELNRRISQILSSLDGKIQTLSTLGADTAKYNASLSEIEADLNLADSLADSLNNAGDKDRTKAKIAEKREGIKRAPSVAEVSQTQGLVNEYKKLRKEFYDNLARQDFDYLLGDTPDRFPAKLLEFKKTLDDNPDNPKMKRYSNKIQKYINGVSRIQRGIKIPFTVTGASGGEHGYTVSFDNAPGFPQGFIDDLDNDKTIRVPVAGDENVAIILYQGDVNRESYSFKPGYFILSMDGEQIPFAREGVDIRFKFELSEFYSLFKDKLD
ncbi:MAG: hypothetical protein J7K40_07675 [candidate division Zixibacteria bacterium]|nr:hypothetical protein [candidate division Zixibacteria bacterium]